MPQAVKYISSIDYDGCFAHPYTPIDKLSFDLAIAEVKGKASGDLERKLQQLAKDYSSNKKQEVSLLARETALTIAEFISAPLIATLAASESANRDELISLARASIDRAKLETSLIRTRTEFIRDLALVKLSEAKKAGLSADLNSAYTNEVLDIAINQAVEFGVSEKLKPVNRADINRTLLDCTTAALIKLRSELSSLEYASISEDIHTTLDTVLPYLESEMAKCNFTAGFQTMPNQIEHEALTQAIYSLITDKVNHFVRKMNQTKDVNKAPFIYAVKTAAVEAIKDVMLDQLNAAKFLAINPHLLAHIRLQPDESLLLNASNRQSLRMDLMNKGRNQNGSCFATYDLLERVSGRQFHRMLLADLDSIANPILSKAWLNISKRMLAEEHEDYYPDESKLRLVYAQIHEMARCFSNQKVVYEFLDDRDHDILAELKMFFTTYPEMIPSNVELHLYHYEGKAAPRSISVIEGLGPIDRNYRHTLAQMKGLVPEPEFAESPAFISTYLVANPAKLADIYFQRNNLQSTTIAGPHAEYKSRYASILEEAYATARRGNAEKAKAMYRNLNRLHHVAFSADSIEASFVNGAQALNAVIRLDASTITDSSIRAAAQALIDSICAHRNPSWADSALSFLGAREKGTRTEQRIKALADSTPSQNPG
ncbi:MAG: hypothetical protein K0R66_287 [Gammaproteobacteria bacterium]|nr:hypothetical protein [Gammaproteobacteria bacterium]